MKNHFGVSCVVQAPISQKLAQTFTHTSETGLIHVDGSPFKNLSLAVTTGNNLHLQYLTFCVI